MSSYDLSARHARSCCTLFMFLQGPSLFAYNDALFEAKDWTGIRMLGDSVKEKDPLKVGRFGLGFKSVYHMTGTSLLFREVPQ